MIRRILTLIFIFFISLSSFASNEYGTNDHKKIEEAVIGLPAADTIYQVDTVFQYEYVYDTIYYYDTIPQSDTTVSVFDAINETDSSTTMIRTFDFLITEKRAIYIDKNSVPQDFRGRDFREVGESEIPEINYTSHNADRKPPKIKKQKKVKSKLPPPENLSFIFPFRSHDTLYRFDTIYNFKIKFDTIKFERKLRYDTVISNQITYKNLGRSVLAKETVNIKVTERKDIFKDNTSIWSADFSPKKQNKSIKKSSTILSSKYRNSFDHTPRVGQEHTFSGNLRIGFSFFKPDIRYTARKDEFETQIEKMNQKHKEQNSHGLSFTYQYFKDKLGFELGLGFSNQNYNYDYDYQQMITDTTFHWDYFERQIYQYDTVWYFDLDRFLQTGDSLFIPSVDSILIPITDSTQKMKVDSIFENRVANYKYSFSFLEIPVIWHYTLVERKFYLSLGGGFIPMLMISKSGTFSYPESDRVFDASQITFDYGFMLALYGSATIGYKFNNRWLVYAEPYVRRNVFSRIQNDEIRLRTNSWGIKAGVSFRLFNYKSK